MPFADVELAARIERSEARLIEGAARVVLSRTGDDAFVVPIAGGIAAFTEPQSPLDKVAGVGFCGPIDERELEALERAYRERACPVQFEVSTLADPSIAALLTRRGYVLVGFENVLGLDLSSVQRLPIAADVEIRSTSGDLDTWLDVVATGFAAPDTQGVPSHESFPRDVVERVVADFVAAPGVVRYLALRGGVPVGGASLRIDEGIAQLCGAATLPEHRRRGVQTALLAARLRDAREAGCDLAVLTTQPGSKSQQNAHRRGFALLYVRAVLVREP